MRLKTSWLSRAGWLCLLVSMGACSTSSETPVQNAKLGDVLVMAKGARIELAKTFTPGVSNGLYKGAIRIRRDGENNSGQLHAVSAVCSLKGEPDWPSYDNLYGNPIDEPAQAEEASMDGRWQILFHFDGRVENKGSLANEPWQERLKNNLCRRGEFNDSQARSEDPAQTP